MRPWIAVALLVTAAASAEPQRYRIGSTAEGSKLEAIVVYSLGSHTQSAGDVGGEVRTDPATLAEASGAVVVPLAGIKGDGSTRDCHMRESLGIDYAGSRFPAASSCLGGGGDN